MVYEKHIICTEKDRIYSIQTHRRGNLKQGF